MGSTAFDMFVQQEQEKTRALDHDKFDPEREKQEWLRYIDTLYRMVIDYLDDYIRAGQIAITYRETTINEEYLGDYIVRQMLITIGTKVIRLEPIGTLFIGSKGRIDVIGPILRAQLMLVNSRGRITSVSVTVTPDRTSFSRFAQEQDQPDWVWRLITRPPERRIEELTKEAFLDLLLEIGNG